MKKIAEYENLILRHPLESDLPYFGDLARDAHMIHLVDSDLLYACRHLGVHHPSVIRTIFCDPLSLLAVAEVDGVSVGYVRLSSRRTTDTAFLETTVRVGGWGVRASRLLLAYALDTRNLYRVETKAFRCNLPSIAALRRNGFQQEGVLRDAGFHEDTQTRCDLLVFAILADEMRRQRGPDEPSGSVVVAPVVHRRCQTFERA